MTIQETLIAYHHGGQIEWEHNRYRSWEHCYRFFREKRPEAIVANPDHAALHLAFYLASWGMYRGSSFLLQHAYSAHLDVVDLLVQPRFSVLWKREFGASEDDTDLLPLIVDLITATRAAYQPFADAAGARPASDTLVSKAILGTLACIPACDRYFKDGFRMTTGSSFSLRERSLEQVLSFCVENLDGLREEQTRIKNSSGLRYPLMKLIDMYFWQIGLQGG